MTFYPHDDANAGPSRSASDSSSTTEEPAFNLAVLEELKELAGPANPDPLREVLGLFLSDSPIRYQGLIDAWKVRDVTQMHAFAHALKGSAANLGARRLMSLLSTLDRDLKAGLLDSAPSLMARIDVEFTAAMSFLHDYLRRHERKE